MSDASAGIWGIVITTMGSIVAIILAAVLSRNKTKTEEEKAEADIEDIAITSANRVSTGCLELLKAQSARFKQQTERLNELEQKLIAVQKENIDHWQKVAEMETKLTEVEKLERENNILTESLLEVIEGTRVLSDQVINLGEVPKYKPPPLIRLRGKDKEK